jgi:segregation and condensation protein B
MTIESDRKAGRGAGSGRQPAGVGPRSPRSRRASKGSPGDGRLRLRSWQWLRAGRDAAGAEAPSGGESSARTSGAPATLPSGDVVRAHLKGLVEALVFASDRPMPAAELARAAKANRALVKDLLAELVDEYRSRGFRLDEVAGGYAFRTSATFAPFVRDLALKKPVRMSRALVETLAIVAYRQPITRPEIDDVRGVDSGPVLKTLLERDLVRILGKKDEPGRPLLYGTTAHFLEFFGLRSIADLPTLREFTELSDESRRTYEQELGEEAPEAGQMGEGFAGGEGALAARADEGEVVPEGEGEGEGGKRDAADDGLDDDGGAEGDDGDEDDDDDDGDEDDDDDDDDEDDDDDDDDEDDDDDDDEDEDEDE